MKRALIIAVVACGLGSFAARNTLLSSAGGLLIADDPLRPADVAIMTPDSDWAGVLELSDLVANQVTNRVGVLIAWPSDAARELARRGVSIQGAPQLLAALRVPPEMVALIPAGEGGTTDGMAALAAWCRAQGVRRVIVVTPADHGRRVKRALTRAFGGSGPEVLVHSLTYDSFRASDWWRDRRTLRGGIIELQKLALDYAWYPLTGW